MVAPTAKKPASSGAVNSKFLEEAAYSAAQLIIADKGKNTAVNTGDTDFFEKAAYSAAQLKKADTGLTNFYGEFEDDALWGNRKDQEISIESKDSGDPQPPSELEAWLQKQNYDQNTIKSIVQIMKDNPKQSPYFHLVDILKGGQVHDTVAQINIEKLNDKNGPVSIINTYITEGIQLKKIHVPIPCLMTLL